MVGLYGGAPLESAAINEQGTDAVPASTGEALGAAFGQGLAGNLFARGLRSQGRFTAETGLQSVDEFGRPIMGEPEPPIDPETANSEYGIKGHLSFDRPVPRSVAQDLFDHKRAAIEREDTIARREEGILTGGVARFAAAAAAGLLDPVNLAAGFIPFVGEERIASTLGRAALETMGAGERAGIRALAGTSQGALSIAALQPLEFGLSRGEHEDYTMADALRNIAIGGVLGGGLHVVGSAVADRVTGRYRNPITQQIENAGPDARETLLRGALAQTIEGRPVDVATPLRAFEADRAAAAGETSFPPRAARVEPELPRPTVIGREEFLRPFTDARGGADLGAASDALAAQVKTALDAKQQVTLFADGKPIPIVSVDRGQMIDGQGNRWGTVIIATDKTGGNRVEIAPASQGSFRTSVEINGNRTVVEGPTDALRSQSPQPVPAAPPIDGGIAGDRARQLVAAGRPADEAQAAGAWEQAYYETRAAQYGGRKGSAEDLYRAEAPIVRGEESSAIETAEHPQEEAPGRIFDQSVALRTGKEKLEGLPGRPNNRQLAEALEARTREKFGTIDRKDHSEAATDRISDAMVEEVKHEFRPGAANKSGVGWYSYKFQKALDHFAEVFPELKDRKAFAGVNLPGVQRLQNPKNARNFLTALIAITSDGQKVAQNFRYAARLYNEFRETGVVPSEITFGGDRNLSMRTNLKNISQLLEQRGPKGMHDWLMTEDTVSNLARIAREQGIPFNSNYLAARTMPQAAVVFGEKLGAFYSNLMGSHGYLTMDRWWSRSFNRYRGQLLTHVSPTGMDRFRRLIGEPDLSDEATIARAMEVQKTYAAKKFKNGTEIEKAGNTIAKDATGLEDMPWSANDREFMINAVERAQQKLAASGRKISIADIQAVLWYYEKRLYTELKGAKDAADVSYADIAKQVVDEAKATSDVANGRAGNLRSDDAGTADANDGGDAATGRGDAGPAGAGRGLEQSGRGRIFFPDPDTGARAVITILRDGDASTFIHETGHNWLETLMRDERDPQVPPELIDAAKTVRDWLGVKQGEAIPTSAHEKFATGLERYMREGRAPNASLAGVFEQFKQWLTAVYRRVTQLGAPISDDIREVFDRLLSMPEDRVPNFRAEARQAALDAATAARRPIETDRVATQAADRAAAEPIDTLASVNKEIDDLERQLAPPESEATATEGAAKTPEQTALQEVAAEGDARVRAVEHAVACLTRGLP